MIGRRGGLAVILIYVALIVLWLLTGLGAAVDRAAAAPSGGVGATLISPDNFGTQIDSLRRMRADTVRLHMAYDPYPDHMVFDRGHIEQLHAIGIRTFILRTGEIPDLASAARVTCNAFRPLAGAYPGSTFVYEIGNEPNIAGVDPYVARWHLLRIARDVKPRCTAPNVVWAASLSTVYDQAHSRIQDNYFHALTSDTGDGLGTVYRAYDAVAVHGYGYQSLERSDGAHPWAVYDWVRGHSSIPIYVTEMGIDGGRWPDKAYRLRDAATRLPYGVKAITYFTLSPDGSWPTFAITPEGASIIGGR